MYGEKKEKLQSIRMTEKHYNYIASQEGRSFNDKFSRLMKKFMESESDLDSRLQYYQDVLDGIYKDINKYRSLLSQLKQIEGFVSSMFAYIPTGDDDADM